MATLLRYVRHLTQNRTITKWINISQSIVESNASRLRLHNQRVTNLTRNYATRAVDRQAEPIYSFEKSFQTLEVQLRRSGRTNRADIERILGEIQLAGTVPSLEALLLIRCCGRPMIDQNSKEGVQLVQEIWDTLERLKIPMDVSHFNALLNVYLERHHSFSPAEFLRMMVEKQIVPNRVTYHRLIEGYCRKGDIVNATKVIDMMRTNNLPLCENVFNSLITGYSEANDIENAESTLETMKSTGIEPSADTYGALLCAYAKRGDMSSITKTIAKLESLEITLLDQHLMDIIETLATNGHSDKAAEFSLELPKEIRQDTEVGRLLVKLMEIKQTKLALEILKNTTTDAARLQVRTGFLLRAAATNKLFTNDELVTFCTVLEDEGLHPRPFSIALYHVLSRNANPSVVIPLMNAWKKRGGQIREHYFWPVLRTEARASNYQGIIDVLKSMVDDFKIIPSVDTLRDYTIPFMFGTWDNIIGKLLPLGIQKPTILQAIAHRSINDKKLRNAMMFMRSYPIKYSKDLFLEPMAFSLNMWDDTKSFVTILRFLGDECTENPEHNVNNIPISISDEAMAAVLSTIPKYRPNIVEKLLHEFEAAGLSISSEVGETVKSFFEPHKAAELDHLISKLTSGELIPVPMEEYNSYLKDKNNDYIKRPTGVNVSDLRIQFAYHLENKNEEKILKILRQLQALDYQSPPVLAQSLELFCSTENLEAAEYCFNQFKEHCHEVGLDTMKTLSFATLLVKKDRLQDAMMVLAEASVLDENEKFSRGLKGKVRSLLESIAETQHVENTHQLFNLLKSKNYIVFDNYSLGPLVKVHLLRKEIDKAMEIFERFSNEYKCTPYKNVLASALIDAEDANSLQRLTDLCTEIHGESNALVDLAMLFLEAGRPIQARKILETSGIQIFNDKITSAVRHFDITGKLDCLELLSKISRRVVRIDRGHLYNSLLEVYNNRNDWQKGLTLWTEMQEIDVQPTNYFLNTLNSLLTRNAQPVPFVSEDFAASRSLSPVQSVRNTRRQRFRNIYDGEKFNQALNRKNWSGAEDIIRSELRERKEMRFMYAELIKAVLETGEVDRATDIVRSVIQEFAGIPKRIFSLVCDELLKKKKYKTIEDIGTCMNESLKDDLNYYKIFSHCQIQKFGIRKYLEGLSVDESQKGSRSSEKKIHFGAILQGLLEDPSYLEEYEKWGRNMADRQIFRGMHVLWNYHFIKNNAKAEELWNEFIVHSSSPLVRPIVEVSAERKDPVLLKKLLMKLESHPRLNIGTKCRVISGLIRVYNSMEQYEEGLKVLNEASKRFRLSLLTLDTLQALRDGIEKSGKNFPFNLDKQDTSTESEQLLEEQLQESGRA
ncbi:leucine-rich PPR motif-containing protein, mitochondrial [Diachasma alloeum]|uniref:leucine-rich PPR motif-containing protein, mitochondrial n=1 Tax=Diachasma alloeum TaxID=454923 RepID=UPI000738370B|nr:leucine-rich PPR motif-containing protein, mitochondrial [Diachasma alloeum]